MNLTEKDIELFKALNQTDTGKQLVDYLNRLQAFVFNPEKLTVENLAAKKEAIGIIKEHIIERIELVNQGRKVKEDWR